MRQTTVDTFDLGIWTQSSNDSHMKQVMHSHNLTLSNIEDDNLRQSGLVNTAVYCSCNGLWLHQRNQLNHMLTRKLPPKTTTGLTQVERYLLTLIARLWILLVDTGIDTSGSGNTVVTVAIDSHM